MRKAGVEIQLHETSASFPFRVFWDHSDVMVNTPSHWHTEIEFLLIVQGSHPVYINGASYHLQKGDIMMAVGGDIHGTAHNAQHPLCRRIFVQFSPMLLENKYFTMDDIEKIQAEFASMQRVSLFWPSKTTKQISYILYEFQKAEQQPGRDVGYKLKIKSLLYRLMAVCYEELPRSPQQTSREKFTQNKTVLANLQKVFSYVNTHYREDIKISAMAELLSLSENYFIKFWKRYSGISFHTYLNEFRVHRAIHLLLETDRPISQVCRESGFQNYKTFYRVFKSQTGMIPSVYRDSGVSSATGSEEECP